MVRVGDEVITRHELNTAVLETIERLPQLRAQLNESPSQAQRAHDIDMLYRQVLADLIDRSLLVQEAKRHIKDKTMLSKIYEDADRMFREQEIEPLQRKYHVDTEAKVKEKLSEEGRSLEAMRSPEPANSELLVGILWVQRSETGSRSICQSFSSFITSMFMSTNSTSPPRSPGASSWSRSPRTRAGRKRKRRQMPCSKNYAGAKISPGWHEPTATVLPVHVTTAG